MSAFLDFLKKPGDGQTPPSDGFLARIAPFFEPDGRSDEEAIAEARKQLDAPARQQLDAWEERWRKSPGPRPRPAAAQPAPGQTAPTLAVGEPDDFGETVCKIHLQTDAYDIWCAKDETDNRTLRYRIRRDYAEARPFRNRLAEITPDIAVIADVLQSIRPSARTGEDHERFRTFRNRIQDMTARAMACAFDDDLDEAKRLVAIARADAETRRDSANRMRYANATLTAVLGLLVIAAAGAWADLWLADEKLADLLGPHQLRAGADAAKVQALYVLLAGAVGAFFSVALDLRTLKVGHAITRAEVAYSGVARIAIGAIAAMVVLWLLKGGWILASLDPHYMSTAALLLGFIAGFAERFVPNALKTIESQTSVAPPGGGGR
ncbi:MAG: hypothetical protein ACQEUZ_03090 [Pseudomonadota bacterium]